MKEISIQTASGRDGKYAEELGGEWLFGGRGKELNDIDNYEQWKKVTLPHTWNATDADIHGGGYVRDSFWYHKEFDITDTDKDKEIFIEFLGVNEMAEVYINKIPAGEPHMGGYTAFRYNITGLVKKGRNVLDVKADNRQNQKIAPISADFNMYGGIYRRVYLIKTNKIHFDLNNYGSSGMFINAGNMRSKERPENLGCFNIKTNIVNKHDKDKKIEISVVIQGENAPEIINNTIIIHANESMEYNQECCIKDPVLWEGADYSGNNKNVGYMYDITLIIKDGEEELDRISDKTGFRYFWIDEYSSENKGCGFYLNGKKHSLRGVNRHSFFPGAGNALTEEQHETDMDIIKELGANSVRLCHYPHTDYFYDLCDENGIVVWTEIPLVNAIGMDSEFEKVTKIQLRELIRQQYNRPSVIFWGLENEIGNGSSLSNATESPWVRDAKKLVYDLDSLTKEEDSTGRYTTQAVNRDYSMNYNNTEEMSGNFQNNTGWKSDIISWNIYPGWYPDDNFYGTFEEVMERKRALDNRPMGISEYGWGGNPWQHEAHPMLLKNGLEAGGMWHPEEYQCIMNEQALKYINSHEELWSTYCWVLFDFAVEGRNEGSTPATNDKGLVTADRKIKKDSFYLYKANWNKEELFTYITGKRWTNRDEKCDYIKVYSNCQKVRLFINNKDMGYMKKTDNNVFIMDNIVFEKGMVCVKAVGKTEESSIEYTDSFKFMENT